MLTHENVHVNGIRLHCATVGEGPLVLLLHGFPECWYSWRHQIPVLAEAGFRVVAPDLRGYNDSEKPASGYDLGTLVEDVAGLIDHYGSGRAVVAGHDWGGAVAWSTALHHSERVERLIALNLPHPTLMSHALLTNPRQMLRSLYILLFRLPRVPEWLLSRGDYRVLEWLIRGSAARRERFTDADLEVYKAAARKPGGLTGGLNYYRALKPADVRRTARGGPVSIVRMPTLLLWGEKDPALGKELTYGTERYVPDLTLQYFPHASHWLQQEEPEGVSEAMLRFLKRG